MDIIEIVSNKINVQEIINKVKAPNCGAVSMFIGTTRNTFDGLEVETLNYEAYKPMALKALKVVCQKVREKWPTIENIGITHKLGEVEVSEISVVVAISSPHRAESLSAVSYTMEELKSSVPIWKKEIYKNKSGEWKENKECLWGSTVTYENQN